MPLTIPDEPIPLRVDEHGSVRVVGSRVTLDTIVGRFLCGDSAEEIFTGFPTVSLADIYSILGYYLRHRKEVDAYLAEQEAEAERVFQEIDRHQSPANEEFWKMLRARHAERERERQSA